MLYLGRQNSSGRPTFCAKIFEDADAFINEAIKLAVWSVSSHTRDYVSLRFSSVQYIPQKSGSAV